MFTIFFPSFSLLLLIILFIFVLNKVISMYTEAPFEEITLDEFELVALDRLQVLRKIEDLRVRSRYDQARKTTTKSYVLLLLSILPRHIKPPL